MFLLILDGRRCLIQGIPILHQDFPHCKSGGWGQCNINPSVTVVTVTEQLVSLTYKHMYVYGAPHIKMTVLHPALNWMNFFKKYILNSTYDVYVTN